MHGENLKLTYLYFSYDSHKRVRFISLHRINGHFRFNRGRFISCAVRTKCLNNFQVTFSLRSVNLGRKLTPYMSQTNVYVLLTSKSTIFLKKIKIPRCTLVFGKEWIL